MKYDIPEDELRRMYIEEGKTQKEIAEVYGCSRRTIGKRLKDYGIETGYNKSDKYSKWSDPELVSWFKDVYPEGNLEEIRKELDMETIDAVRHRANKLGIKRGKYWTDEEIEFLEEYYEDSEKDFLLKHLDRGWKALCIKAERLGLSRDERNFWSEDEEDLLREIYDTLTWEEIMYQFPDRTKMSIIRKAQRLNLSRNRDDLWSDEELRLLKSNYKDTTWDELDEMFPDRTLSAIKGQLLNKGWSGRNVWGRKYKIEDVTRMVEDHDYKFIEYDNDKNGFITVHTYITVSCPEDNHVLYKVKLNDWIHGIRCIQCKWENMKGENNHFYDPTLTDEQRVYDRNYPEYREWRMNVYRRDGFHCVVTGIRGSGNIVAHHLESYADNPDLRTVVSNGVTLLEPIHILFHSIYGNGKNNTQQFEEFVKDYNDGKFKEELKEVI